jgi:predicted enzyme related to lactoylglutathione lyase
MDDKFFWNDKSKTTGGSFSKTDKIVNSGTGMRLYIISNDIEKTKNDIEENGGKITLYLKQDYGSILKFEDCEGNTLGCYQ